MNYLFPPLLTLALALTPLTLNAKDDSGVQRARDLGVPFTGTPGPNNAITDVDGVLVGHTTLIEDKESDGGSTVAVRTGVTAILPTGKDMTRMVAAGRAVINGTGEMTGSWLVDEVGGFTGPIMLTSTTSVGMVHHATSRWIRDNVPEDYRISGFIPVVAETLDIHLNDIWGYHVQPEHVFAAIDSAASGPVSEGNVGGGTGMIAYAFKGGIGTASRVVSVGDDEYTVGVLLQANHGKRKNLHIAGVPVGQEIPDRMPTRDNAKTEKNSLLIIIATDAPLNSTQLKRLARRASLGVGRGGSIGGYMSGELALAFSTGNSVGIGQLTQRLETPTAWNGEALNGLFAGTIEAVEEALVNCLVAAETMTGAGGLTVYELPAERLQAVLRAHNRLRVE